MDMFKGLNLGLEMDMAVVVFLGVIALFVVMLVVGALTGAKSLSDMIGQGFISVAVVAGVSARVKARIYAAERFSSIKVLLCDRRSASAD